MTSVATSADTHLPHSFSSDEPKIAGRWGGSAETSSLSLDEGALSQERVSIVDGEGLRAMGELARSHGYLWIHLDPPGPQHRGRLGLYLEEAIEVQLEERGALPPGIQASTGLDASLSDQLYRARLVEMRGIALGIPNLEGITNLGRSLDADDSAVLRWWIAAAADRPVRLVISNQNTKLRVYPSPVLFESLFDVAPSPVTPIPPSPQMAESSQSMDLSDLPPAVVETNVLGTEVATLEGDSEAALAFAHQQVDGAEAYPYPDGGYLEDVDLPELDRALGLVPDAPPVIYSALTVGHKRPALADAPAQLALDYESPFAPEVSEERHRTLTQIASPPPPAQEPVSEDTLQSVTDGAFLGADDRGADEEASFDKGHSELSEAQLAREAPDEASARESADFEDLDEDDFLRTLAEDSAQAPVASELENSAFEEEAPEASFAEEAPEASFAEEAPEASPEVEIPAPAPASAQEPRRAPQKNERSSFIRMANPDDAVCNEDIAEAEVESATPAVDEGGNPESQLMIPVGDIPLDGRTLVDLRLQQNHEKTLSGAAAPDPNDPFNQLAAREWKTWVKNLEAARGPKPLSVIERMFVTDYTRLREAVRRGVASPSAEGILDEWRDSFSKSYSEAFDALRVRGKRPTMVLDLPELATRLGRLQGAKRVQLLLVDALRFDLGLMVQDRMRERVDAALTERLLLWSALPATTSYQLELLGKGPDGLKSAPEMDEPPALVARGAAARVPRRVRTGGLELLKLDVVEDSLRTTGPPIAERMDIIADETASALADHLSKQPPRTMVVAFGDHGFSLDVSKAGTTEEVSQGGSSPEEILVPAFAWLTGAVH